MASTTVRLSLSGADCKVCFQAYDAGWRRPRALPCGHTFCSICMASIIRDCHLTCPGCQAHHSVEVVTQLPVNYELESLLKLQPGLEAEYYHEKAGPISLSDVMCTAHNCDVYLRCTTHKAWICQQCTLSDHPINKCKIISISEELEVRKESLLMFLNEEYERSVQSLLRVRQSLAQVEDEDKKHEEVIGHMAEIILQHRDEQGHLGVQREALEQSIEDLKDKTWVLDQAVLNLQDALSVQQIVASCQEAQANLAYIKDFADVSNIEQTSMDAILHSYKIRATTSMGLHAMHGTSSNDNNEPDKPTCSSPNDVDKNQNSQNQENNDDTGINQKEMNPSGSSNPVQNTGIKSEIKSCSQNLPVSSSNKSHLHQNIASNINKSGTQNTVGSSVNKYSIQNTGISNLKQNSSQSSGSYNYQNNNDDKSNASINSKQINQLLSTSYSSFQSQRRKSHPVTLGSLLKSDPSFMSSKPSTSPLSSPTSFKSPPMTVPAAPPRERPALFSPTPGSLLTSQSSTQSDSSALLTQSSASRIFSPTPHTNGQSSIYSTGDRAPAPITRPLSPLTYTPSTNTNPSSYTSSGHSNPTHSTTMRNSSSSRTTLALPQPPTADQQKASSDYTQRSTSSHRPSKWESSLKSGRLYTYS